MKRWIGAFKHWKALKARALKIRERWSLGLRTFEFHSQASKCYNFLWMSYSRGFPSPTRMSTVLSTEFLRLIFISLYIGRLLKRNRVRIALSSTTVLVYTYRNRTPGSYISHNRFYVSNFITIESRFKRNGKDIPRIEAVGTSEGKPLLSCGPKSLRR